MELRMKLHINFFIVFLGLALHISAQIKEYQFIPGIVSHISSQNLYVTMSEQNLLEEGDTLFYKIDGQIMAGMVVKFKSSRSVAGPYLPENIPHKGDTLYAKIYTSINNDQVSILYKNSISDEDEINPPELIDNPESYNSNIKGRISVSSYSTLSNTTHKSDQRWRYLISLKGKDIYESPFSIDSYISFRYKNSEWSKVKTNIGNALKIYSLALKYRFGSNFEITLGRTYNKWITNLGTMDGFQIESKLENFYTGLLIGSRPNFTDFGYNLKLLQFGGYVGRADTIGSGIMQNSIGFVQQTNDYKIDRRFIYLQHSNSSIDKFNFFLSSEIDLYGRKNGVGENKVSLTGLYTSLRYSPARWLSINTSYDARKNVIYYETYKSYADSVLDSHTRQGARLRFNLRPIRNVSLALSYGHRFKSTDINQSQNYSASLSIIRTPYILSSLNFSYTGFESNYLKGQIFGTRITKDISQSKVTATLAYRYLLYDYSSNLQQRQNIISMDISANILPGVSISANFEGTFQDKNTYSRFFINLTKRF